MIHFIVKATLLCVPKEPRVRIEPSKITKPRECLVMLPVLGFVYTEKLKNTFNCLPALPGMIYSNKVVSCRSTSLAREIALF